MGGGDEHGFCLCTKGGFAGGGGICQRFNVECALSLARGIAKMNKARTFRHAEAGALKRQGLYRAEDAEQLPHLRGG